MLPITLYAANHPGPRTGLREIGVAVNTKPERLENPDKTYDPVLRRNAERLAHAYRTILPTGEYNPWEARYSLKPPAEGRDWTLLDYKMKGWRSGEGGFGFPFEEDGAQIHSARTKWDKGQLWIRRSFELKGVLPKTPVLNIRHEGPVMVFLNGKVVYQSAEPHLSYSNFDISKATEGFFHDTKNVLAVKTAVNPESDFQFLDFGLFDAGTKPVEATVYSLDAPRIVEGPNGFEKWLTYHAWWNGVAGTGLDRLYFYDDELVVDGPTTANTAGYHPPPAKPTFLATFSPENVAVEKDWQWVGGKWGVTNGVLRQVVAHEPARALLRKKPAKNYLFETYIRFPKNGKSPVGVVAFFDGENEMLVSINPATKKWEYYITPGAIAPKKLKLPKAFKVSEVPTGFKETQAPLHRLRIVKNGGYFEVFLDDFKLTAEKPIITKFTGAGVPGLYCGYSAAEFDAIKYTVGWDEYGAYITGWGAAADGSKPSGEWKHFEDDGLEQKRHSEVGRAFKGDLLDQYEFTVNARTEQLEEGKERLYGVFPVFVDQKNYLKAMIDTRRRELVVTGMRNGEAIDPITASLHRQIPHTHLYDKNTAYRDVGAWVYALRSTSIITGLDVRWLEGKNTNLRQEFQIPFDDMIIRYANIPRERDPLLWEDARFYDADEPKPITQKPGILNLLSIRPVKGNYIGFGFYVSIPIVVDEKTGRFIRVYDPREPLQSGEIIIYDDEGSDTESRPQETIVTVEVESSYFFRCVKLKDRVIIELNGQPMVTVLGSWADSQVGLLTEGQPCFFDGITLMHLPVETDDK